LFVYFAIYQELGLFYLLFSFKSAAALKHTKKKY